MGAAAALSAALCWAFGSLLFERFGRGTGGLALNAVKCTVALAMMLPTLYLISGTWWPTDIEGAPLRTLLLSGIIGLSIGDTFWFGSLLRVGARRALLLFTLSPVMTALLGAWVLREPITLTMLSGMTVTLAGVAWVISERIPGAEDDDAHHTRREERVGFAMGVAAALCQAIGTIMTKHAGDGFPALDVSIVRMVAGTAGILVMTAVAGRLPAMAAPFRDRRTGAAVIGATFLGTYLGVWLMNAGFLLTWVGVASTLNAMSPIFVLPLVAIFLGEHVSKRAIVGAGVSVAGVAILFFTATGS